MFISVNPSYLCNFRCSFCYLTKEQLSDTKTVDLDQLTGLLYEIKAYKPEEEFIFDLYGGEISSLPDKYILSLIDVLSLFTREPIRITTNLSRIPDYLYDERVSVAVSYDYRARQDWQTIVKNMKTFSKHKDLEILMLASKNLIRYLPEEIIGSLDDVPWIKSIEIKPYSINQANADQVSHKDYEEFVKKFIAQSRLGFRKILINNELLIRSVLDNERNAFSDDHIYITPNGRFAVLEFDSNDREYFLELDSFQNYLEWTDKEKTDAYLNGHCSVCEYFGRCLTEHLREVKDISKSCNGFKHLLDWYKNEQIPKDIRLV